MSSDAWQNAFFLRNPDGSLDTYRLEDTFPKLTNEQFDAIRPFADELEIPAGQILFRRGDRDVDFFVVLRGAIEIFETDSCGKEHLLVIHRERNFTGEVTLFSNQKYLGNGRTGTATRVLRVRNRNFRRMLTADSELGALILRAFVLRRSGVIRHHAAGVTVIGDSHDRDLLRISEFMIRNGYPYRVLAPDAKAEDGKPLLEHLSLHPSDLPVVWVSKERILKNPSLFELASELGLVEDLPLDHVYDVAIVGGGPAGLAASVYAASEGLDTVLLEALAPGGQAGTSSRIENYLGFPNGISGQELAARAVVQAIKFGAHLVNPRPVERLAKDKSGIFEITLCDQTRIRTRTVIVATGATYRKLDLSGYDIFCLLVIF